MGINDLPTLDDPNIANDGQREDANGLDVAGPWGGNDGLNQAVLPADAPLRIFADGLRNNYDLVRTSNGIYTVDNGSNVNVGGDPVDVNGITTGQLGSGEATNTIVNAGTGDNEPIFLIEDGGYYGHANPTRSNQDLAWTVYSVDEFENPIPDPSLAVASVADISDLVPSALNIPDGFLIDPSKFTADPARLEQSGIRVQRKSSASNPVVNPLFNLGNDFASTNGLIEYTDPAFDGALQDALIAVDLSGSVTLVKLNSEGTALEPVVDPGADGILNTSDDEVLSSDGVYQLLSGISTALDITQGPDGTLWIASLFGAEIQVYEPSPVSVGPDEDVDDDGIANILDPFTRDPNNGRDVTLTPGQSLLWDFDEDLDGNLPGPGGYASGLTGVLVNGTTDYEQTLNFGNVKFVTASGGGTTVVENVSNGDPLTSANDGEYLFHTGVTIDPTVSAFTIKWSVANPAGDPSGAFSGPSQQIGGYLGAGDQSNYLKIVATQDLGGEIQILLEENDVVQVSSFIQASDLFTNVSIGQNIFFELEIDITAKTATPTIRYDSSTGLSTVSGTAIDLTGTQLLDVIEGNYIAPGDTGPTGLAVGLFSSNTGQSASNTFAATFNDIEIVAESAPLSLSIDDVTVNEGAGTATFMVSLSEPSTDTVTVDYMTTEGTAISGDDFVAGSGTLTFDPGTTVQSVTISVSDDDVIEDDETFQVLLSNAVNAVIADDLGQATIQDNDAPASSILYRVNVGGETVASSDGLLDWSGDTAASPSPYLVSSENRFQSTGQSVNLSDPSLPAGALVEEIYQTHRWDSAAAPQLTWAFDVEAGSEVEVRIYGAEWWVNEVGQRDFAISVEGSVPVEFSNVDPVAIAGQWKKGYVLTHNTVVSDGTLNIDFVNGSASAPWVSAIEIVSAGAVPASLSIDDVSVDEGAGTATFTVNLSKSSSEVVTVDYSTADGTAFSGSDYDSASGSLTFLAGETSQSFTVAITPDSDLEGDETFSASLSNVVGAEISDGFGVATIVDDDADPELSIADVVVNEADGTATFIVSLSKPSDELVSVDYETSDGTAIAGSDYSAASGTLTFGIGDTTQSFTVALLDDDETESDESFTVALSNIVGAIVNAGTGTAMIS